MMHFNGSIGYYMHLLAWLRIDNNYVEIILFFNDTYMDGNSEMGAHV